MSETTTTNPAAPATPAVNQPEGAAAARAAFADLDHLVEINENGVKRVVPLRAVIPEVQSFGAGKAMLAEAKAERAKNAEMYQAGENWRSLQAKLASDPDAVVEQMTRLARLAKGESAAPPSNQNSRAGTPGAFLDDADVQDPKTRDLERRVGQMEQERVMSTQERQIDEVLSKFPALKSNGELEESSRLTLMAALSARPDVPLERVASLLHTGIMSLSGPEATAIRDRRLANGAAPIVPASTGSPDLQNAPATTRADLKNGAFERKMAEGFARFFAPPKPGS